MSDLSRTVPSGPLENHWSKQPACHKRQIAQHIYFRFGERNNAAGHLSDRVQIRRGRFNKMLHKNNITSCCLIHQCETMMQHWNHQLKLWKQTKMTARDWKSKQDHSLLHKTQLTLSCRCHVWTQTHQVEYLRDDEYFSSATRKFLQPHMAPRALVCLCSGLERDSRALKIQKPWNKFSCWDKRSTENGSQVVDAIQRSRGSEVAGWRGSFPPKKLNLSG